MIDVAFSAGFGSVRRFNTLFRARYGLAPGEIRRAQSVSPATETIALRLAYRPPLAWGHLLNFLAARAIAGVEAVTGDAYLRSVEIEEHQGWVQVEHSAEENQVIVTLPTTLTPVLMKVLARLRHLFDLDANPQVIAEQLSTDAQLARLVKTVPGLRVPGAWDGFEMAARAVLGQQISVRGASTLAARLAENFGKPLATSHEAIFRQSPSAETLAAAKIEEIAAIGLPMKRAATLHSLARAVADGTLNLRVGADTEATIEALKEISGIGDWTAQYLAMRALHWPDAFPAGDLALRKAFGKDTLMPEAHLLELAENWRPWRAYAAMYLWSSLS
jgi:AraC family transcriptional regulator of adaptative response / DNA-3-methyladenine glycosylase II